MADRPVFHDPVMDASPYIETFQTRPFNLTRHLTLAPYWEEEIIIDETYRLAIHPLSLLLFELIDVSPVGTSRMARTNHQTVAWAFLRCYGAHGKPNAGYSRLQLYKYPRDVLIESPEPHVPALFYVWQSRREKMQGSLHITLRSIWSDLVQFNDRKVALGHVRHHSGIQKSHNTADQQQGQQAEQEPRVPWRRLNQELFIVPNRLIHKIESAPNGCFMAAFSQSGFYLALACVGNQGSYPIKIYDTLTGEKICTLNSHSDLVYDLEWSLDDRLLVSASSDGSVRCWNVFEDRINNPTCVAVLQHISSVYAAKIYPSVPTDYDYYIMTGSYDSYIRVWRVNSEREETRITAPVNTIAAHANFVNCLTVSSEGSRLYSAGGGDSEIRVWKCTMSFEHGLNLLPSGSVSVSRSTVMNNLVVHPSEPRLFAFSKTGDNIVIDLKLMRILTHLEMPPEKRQLKHRNDWQRISLTPCGTFLFAPTQDGRTCVFDSMSLEMVKVYEGRMQMNNCVSCVAIHPLDHTLALCALGASEPVFILTYDEIVPKLT